MLRKDERGRVKRKGRQEREGGGEGGREDRKREGRDEGGRETNDCISN